MHFTSRRLALSAALTVAVSTMCVACNDDDTTTPDNATKFAETKLVADAAGQGATAVDAHLVNPWGLAFGPTGVLWVSNAETGTSTLYDADGTAHTTVVNIPSASGATGGAPTGVIFNSTADFAIPGNGAALFIFAGEDGVISAWNASTTDAMVVANRSANDAVYKGIAIASNAGANTLYATNFKGGMIDEFSSSFQYVRSFTDTSIPTGYAPFGIQAVGGQLYVTYAKQQGPDNEDDEPGAGNGYVVIFNADGTVARRFASNGTLNAPWAIAVAPSSFGTFAGDILIGNFGDGRINAFDATNGEFRGQLTGSDGDPLVIEGLWGLTFGTGASANTLFFSAGPADETHGLLGTIAPMSS